MTLDGLNKRYTEFKNSIEKGENMTVSNEFKEGYCDGHGQAIENVRYSLIEYLKENGSISIDMVDEICNICSKIDENYLNQ